MDGGIAEGGIIDGGCVHSGQGVAEGHHVLLERGIAGADDLHVSAGSLETGRSGWVVPCVAVEDALGAGRRETVTGAFAGEVVTLLAEVGHSTVRISNITCTFLVGLEIPYSKQPLDTQNIINKCYGHFIVFF